MVLEGADTKNICKSSSKGKEWYVNLWVIVAVALWDLNVLTKGKKKKKTKTKKMSPSGTFPPHDSKRLDRSHVSVHVIVFSFAVK